MFDLTNKRAWLGCVFVSSCCLVSVSAAMGESTWWQQNKLVNSPGQASERLGRSVAISSDYAVVGTGGPDANAPVLIFKRNARMWTEDAVLTGSDNEYQEYFGAAVSISGDYAIVGAPYDDSNGAVYVFICNDANWTEQAKLVASDGTYSDTFGCAVSIDGDYAIIGAHYDSNDGSAYIFKREGTNWIEQDKLPCPEPNDLTPWLADFGGSVSISGDYAVVGAQGNDDEGYETGAAYLYKRNTGDPNWTQIAKLVSSYRKDADNFGCSVSISGDYVIAGAYSNFTRGAAYIFEKPPGGWVDMTETVKITASTAEQWAQFGYCVAIDGNTAVVGTTKEYAFIFEREQSGWSEKVIAVSSDREAGDNFGKYVAVSGSNAIFSAERDDNEYGVDAGSSYIFNRVCLSLLADVNGDCRVDFTDFSTFAAEWLKSAE